MLDIAKKNSEMKNNRIRKSSSKHEDTVPKRDTIQMNPSGLSGLRSSRTSHRISTSVANVTVTVLQLAGLTCQHTISKRSHSNSELDNGDGVAVSAVASFARNTISSNTRILTHIPSLPVLGTSMKQSHNGRKIQQNSRYNARWPAYDFKYDTDDIRHSSFTFSRVLKQEQLSLESSANMPQAGAGFESELVDVCIGLVKGTEIITLGSTTLVVSGQSRATLSNADLIVRSEIPANFMTIKSSSSGAHHSSSNSKKQQKPKKIKYASFPSDPSRRYSLADNATLSVQISVTLSDNPNDHMSSLHYQHNRLPFQTDTVPMPFICPELEKKVRCISHDFGDASTLSESTKSGYIVHPRHHYHPSGKKIPSLDMVDERYPAASEKSPTDVRHLASRQQRSKPKETSMKSLLVDFFCCLPQTDIDDDEENDILKLTAEENYFKKKEGDFKKEEKDKYYVPKTIQSLHMDEAHPANVAQYNLHAQLAQEQQQQQQHLNSPSDKIQNENVIYYKHDNSDNLNDNPTDDENNENKEEDDDVEEEEEDEELIPTTDTVKSIERATQTLHHYANRFGVKAEELL